MAAVSLGVPTGSSWLWSPWGGSPWPPRGCGVLGGGVPMASSWLRCPRGSPQTPCGCSVLGGSPWPPRGCGVLGGVPRGCSWLQCPWGSPRAPHGCGVLAGRVPTRLLVAAVSLGGGSPWAPRGCGVLRGPHRLRVAAVSLGGSPWPPRGCSVLGGGPHGLLVAAVSSGVPTDSLWLQRPWRVPRGSSRLLCPRGVPKGSPLPQPRRCGTRDAGRWGERAGVPRAGWTLGRCHHAAAPVSGLDPAFPSSSGFFRQSRGAGRGRKGLGGTRTPSAALPGEPDCRWPRRGRIGR